MTPVADLARRSPRGRPGGGYLSARNGFRIAGPKTWGGVRNLDTLDFSEADLLELIPTAPISQRPPTCANNGDAGPNGWGLIVSPAKSVKLCANNRPDPQLVAAAFAPLLAARLKDEHEEKRRAVPEIQQGQERRIA